MPISSPPTGTARPMIPCIAHMRFLPGSRPPLVVLGIGEGEGIVRSVIVQDAEFEHIPTNHPVGTLIL
jgi:hypothetical protein